MNMTKNLFVHKQSFNRENLSYFVKPKTKNIIQDLAEIVKTNKNKSGIIYCLSRKDCEDVCSKLQVYLASNMGLRIRIDFYHADIPPEERNRKQALWSKGDVKVLW